MKYQTLVHEKSSWSMTSVWNNGCQNVRDVEATSFSSCCIRGLEHNLSPTLERQRQRRRYLVVEAVLNEQWEQEDAGTYSWDRIAQASRKYTLFCQQQAVERASLDVPSEIRTNIATNFDADECKCDVDNNGTRSLHATQRNQSHNSGGRSIATRDKSPFAHAAGGYQRQLAWIWWSSTPHSTCSSSSWSYLLSHLTPPSWHPAGRLPPIRRRA